ncbi:MAG: nitrite reductase small subunit NirD [Nocardioides sp.]
MSEARERVGRDADVGGSGALDLQAHEPEQREAAEDRWQQVCPYDAVEVERGVTALVHGQAMAVFRTADGAVYALSNHDPFAKASVLARGIVGTRGGRPFVASPMHKQGFDLRTGECLDDPHVRIATYAVRVVDGMIQVGDRQAVP